MMTFILHTTSGRELARVSQEGNDYLFTSDSSFPLLSQIEIVDPAAFGPSDMPALIDELNLLAGRLNNSEAEGHIEEIIRLALRCKNEEGTWMLGTPFGNDVR
jgi:hypothetical protein